MARCWWEKAALKGDEDARDYLHILDAEREEKLSACCGCEKEHAEESFQSFVSDFVCRSAGARVAVDRVHWALGEAGVDLSEATQALAREIEDFLARLDHTTGGPRC